MSISSKGLFQCIIGWFEIDYDHKNSFCPLFYLLSEELKMGTFVMPKAFLEKYKNTTETKSQTFLIIIETTQKRLITLNYSIEVGESTLVTRVTWVWLAHWGPTSPPKVDFLLGRLRSKISQLATGKLETFSKPWCLHILKYCKLL